MLVTDFIYKDIDDILGNREQRFFGTGFKKVNHQVQDIAVSEKCVVATANIIYPMDWSKKSEDTDLKPHLSTIDATVLSLQLNEIYIIQKFGITKAQRRKIWMKRIVLKAGTTPQEDLDNLIISTRHIETKIVSNSLCTNMSIFESQIGSMQIRCEIEHDIEEECNEEASFDSIDEILGLHNKRYYGDMYKNSQQIIEDVEIDFSNQRLTSLVNVKDMDENLLKPEGMEADYFPSLSIIDCMITVAQMAQALIYKIDDIDRSNSNTLWMRKVIIENKNPNQPYGPFIASTHISKSNLLKLKGGIWRTTEMLGEYKNYDLHYYLAHELPYKDWTSFEKSSIENN
ncbi:avirulence D protein (AvrD) [Bacillus thuringiensis]|uniref:Avirulence D protein (AvrD) n=1 Tax=Bacillus thuringiensis TaxID=1428 RepID=A0A4R4B392_BACTU|nr:AvrD family protein [Bacillus thuringiensis]TCW47582.1 avirulence D protein (AvrD) [Bacillus thuringiensis]TCW47738.1 avirulence D protein (AvrD) [Bacillus thuringiensis]